MAPQTAISKAVCYKTKNEQLWEKAVHFLLVATNCFYAGLPTVFCTITSFNCRIDYSPSTTVSEDSCFFTSTGATFAFLQLQPTIAKYAMRAVRNANTRYRIAPRR
jgi:hypothetical protein